ncbi:hypothetical protein I1A62_03560 (plasmid) [Rhodococcus sp. USK10]|uniref:hypothetical protein n=1 Tax=Rhodococcus sp. USK10 TaxID=2789739 RepID=UPI001C5F310D|nr:hypothetical protein [Rhodococcus sp. USK10]QYB00176.1 hypothetical protein I1A62_03560 [Rhodococcus sp. USK10]
MITHGSTSIGYIADYLEDQLGTHPDAPALRKDIYVAAMLTRLVGEDYDRAVDVLIADRAQVVDILSAATNLLPGGHALQMLLQQRLSDQQRSLRVADLTERGDLDNAVIAELHVALTSTDGQHNSHRQLLDQVWEYLGSYAQRRRYRSAP